jgi:hypothetical protein
MDTALSLVAPASLHQTGVNPNLAARLMSPRPNAFSLLANGDLNGCQMSSANSI